MTIASIMFAVLLSIFMRSMQLGSYERMIENSVRFYTGHIQIHQKGYWDDKVLDNSMVADTQFLDKLSQIENIEGVIPRVESFVLSAYDNKTRGALLMGIDPTAENEMTRLKSKLIAGEYLNMPDKSVLVSEGLAKYLKMGVGDTLVMIGQGYHSSSAAGIYPIKGIVKFPIKQQNDQSVFIPIPEAQWFYDAESLLTSISIMAEKTDHVFTIKQAILESTNVDVLEVMDWKELTPELLQSIEIDNISGKFMLYILYLVIGFGILGTFTMMTAERQFEFGVMMSIGMGRLKMQLIIGVEMLMMTFIALVSGILVALPFLIHLHLNPVMLSGELAETASNMGVEAAYYFSLQPELFINQAWAIFIMTIVLGLYPLYSIQKLKPVQAMRA